jgi:hypothetical protein
VDIREPWAEGKELSCTSCTQLEDYTQNTRE